MGCWNGSCFFTGLPIRHGDPAIIFPMIQIETGGGQSGYCSTLFPIEGEYNDYGSMENIKETSLTNKLFQEIKKSHKAFKDYNEDFVPSKDHWFTFGNRTFDSDKDLKSIETVLDGMERQDCTGDSCFVNDLGFMNQIGQYPLSFVMVHGKVWKYLRENLLILEKTWKGETVLDYILKKIRGKDETTIAREEALREVLEKENTPEEEIQEFLERHRGRIFRAANSRELLNNGCPEIHYHSLSGFDVWADGEYCEEGTPEHEAFLSMMTFNAACSSLRRGLNRLHAAAGSQAEDYQVMREVAKIVLQICDEEENPEEEEEEES
jgi:hypothetical protein